MKVEYCEDTDTLQITFTDHVVAEIFDLDENTLFETDEEGRLVTMAIEHAGDRADVGTFEYKTHREGTAA